ncbi:DNA-directed RNA polymerase subunit omega [Candidatus Saganbacteria bacterium]|uniref:DNA-directed RNA polymerase subunit omega n=1 Tax=Candidatus Saganbacteria bacterium TaxID=2575572 RepID=A0A9D6YSU7_UNCSA|nr:DNA-directed RNA polymerase subunit omega [Candidatus Saganbacteria bacterium]
MSEVTIDSLLSKAKNKFLLANAAAGRARQIAEGSLPYVDHFDPTNSVITALREIAADKIRIRVLSQPIKKPQELLISAEEAKPSALERLARGKKVAPPKKKEKKKK